MIPLDPLHLETDPGAVVEDGGVPEEPAAGPPEGWYESDEFQQAVAQQASVAAEQQLLTLLSALDNGQGQQQLDPLADDFESRLEQWFQSRMAPFAEFTEQAQYDEGEARAHDIIADLEASGGEFLGKPGEGEALDVDSAMVARALGDLFYPAAAERHGDGPKAAEAALSHAVEMVRALEETIGKAYAARQSNQLHTLASQRREPGVAATAGTGEVRPKAGSEMEVVRQFFPMR